MGYANYALILTQNIDSGSPTTNQYKEQSVIATTGGLLTFDSNNVPTILNIGANGKYLKSNGTTFSWEDATGTVANNLILTYDGGTTENTDKYTFNGSVQKTINFIAGTNITLTKNAGSITINATDTNTTYTAGTGLNLSDTTFSLANGTAQYQIYVTGANPFTPVFTSAANLVGANGLNSLTYGTSAAFVKMTGANTFTLDTNTYLTTQKTSKNVVNNTNTATVNGSATNGNVYINHLEDTTVTSYHLISGAGSVAVTSDSSGNITITGTDTNTDTLQSVSDDQTNNERFVTFVANASGAQVGYTNAGLKFNGSTKTLTIGGNAIIGGNLTINGTTTTINTSTLTVDDKNIELGSVSSITGLTATLSTGTNIVSVTSTAGMIPGQTLIKTGGTGTFGANAKILSVDSSTQFTATVNHATAGSITFNVGGASNSTANGGGITLKADADGDKTFIWESSNLSWTTNQNINLSAYTNNYKINNITSLSRSSSTKGVVLDLEIEAEDTNNANGFTLLRSGKTASDYSFIWKGKSPPATKTSTGMPGMIAWDINYLYICTANNVWARVPICRDWTN